MQYIHKVFSDICHTNGADCDFASSVSRGASASIPQPSKLILLSQDGRLDKKLLSEYSHISAGMDRLEKGMADMGASVHTVKNNLPQIVRYELRLDRLEQTISRSSSGGIPAEK